MKFRVSKSAPPILGITHFVLLVLVDTFIVATAHAAPIHSEVLSGNGETRSVTTRIITAPSSGRYFLTLKNGIRGPRFVEQCETEDTIQEKRECLFENLNEKIDRDFTRVQDALIYVNGLRVRNPLAPNEKTITKSRGLVVIPVQLVNGANEIRTDLLGFSTASLEYSLEPAPETKAPPAAFFLFNRNVGTTAQPFTLNARESFSPEGNPISYTWFWGDEVSGAKPQASNSTATHTYRTPGVFTAKLEVKDTVTSLTSTFQTEIVVKAAPLTPSNERPKPVIQWAMDGSNPMRALFDGSQSTDDGSISTYTWKITNQAGASQTVTGSSFGYTFSAPGSYTVRLTLKDDLNLSAAQDRVISVAPLSALVADETLFGPKAYFGTFSAEAVATETLILPAPQLARLKIKNGDGVPRSIEDCSSVPWPGKIECLFRNVVSRAYLSLYRLNKVIVSINGRKVTDGVSLTKQTASFETVVSLAEMNTIEIRTRGWPTAFASIELQSLEQNIAPIARVTFTPPGLGLPKLVEFNAATSTDANDQVMSYRFQAKLVGGSSYTLDSDWQADPLGRLTFQNAGNYDVLVSARDKFGAVGTTLVAVSIFANNAPVISSVFYLVLNDVAPYQVRADVIATDPDFGDTLDYSFSFSNGQQTGFRSSNRGIATYGVIGSHYVDVAVRDSAGAVTTQRLLIELDGNKIPVSRLLFATPRSGYAPHTVSFDASGTFDPDGPLSQLTYYWFFGDGTPEIEAAPILTHTYPNGGEYVMTMSVVDGKRGLSQQNRAVFAWTTAPPVPRFTFSRTINSLKIDFDGSTSTIGDSPIQRYTWEFGDGVFARDLTVPRVSYTYSAAGIYTAFLRVYDQEGDADIVGQQIAVFNGQKPIADIQLTSTDNVVPATFGLSARNSVSPNFGAGITNYKWTLPSGETRTTRDITYSTTTAETSEIKLEVRDAFGFWSDVATRTVTSVQGALPIARASADKTNILSGETVRLSGVDSTTPNALSNITQYEWTVPNGAKFFGPVVDVVLTEPGLSQVTLKVTDSKGYVSLLSSVQINVRRLEKPIAVMSLASNGSSTFPILIQANGVGSTTPNLNSVITGYEWRAVAPGQTDISYFGQFVVINLPVPAAWTVSLRVFDSAGGVSDWVSEAYNGNVNRIPLAVISPLGLIDTAPAEIVFNGLSSSDPDANQSIISWHWLFSDGGEAFGPAPTRRYETPGTYTATLRVQDSLWAWSDPVTVTISILQNTAPIGFFTIQNDPVNRYRKTFDASGSFDMDGTIASYSWFVIDVQSGGAAVGIGTGRELNYTFPRLGTYIVVLDVFDNKGVKSQATSLSVTITDAPTLFKAFYEVDEVNPMKFSFKASGTTDADGIASYRWAEGTETLSTTPDFDFTFAMEGVHIVTLEVRDVLGSLTSKTFTVDASTSQMAGIKLLSADSDPIDFFNSGAVEAQTPLSISRLPASVRFRPVLKKPRGDADFEWIVNGIENGRSDALASAIVDSAETSIELKVFDGENVVARARREVVVEPSACELDSDEVCVAVMNGRQGVDIDSGDLVFQIPIDEDITSVGRLIVRSADSATEVDLTDDAVISGRAIIVPRGVVVQKLDFSFGPFEAEMEVLGDTTSVFGEVPHFHLSGPSLRVPSNLLNARLKLTDVATSRVILERSITSGEFITAPWAVVDIEIAETDGDTVWVSRGVASPRIGNPAALTLQRSSAVAGLGTISSQQNQLSVQSVSETPGTFSKMSRLSQQAPSISNPQFDNNVGGMIADEYGQVFIPPALYANESRSGSSNFPFTKYSLKSESVSWTSPDDSPEIIGADTDEVRTLECKAFESSWKVTPELKSYIDRLDGYLADQREKLAINAGYRPLREAVDLEIAWFDANLDTPCGDLGLYDPECMSTYPHQQIPSNSSEAVSRARGYAALYYAARRYQEATSAASQRIFLSERAYLEEGVLIGVANDPGGVAQSFSWSAGGISESRDFEVKMNFLKQKKWSSKTQRFSSRGLKGNYAPPLVDRNVSLVPFNPFSIIETLSVPLQFEVPKGTEAITFEVAPLGQRVKTRKLVLYSGEQFVRENFSAACRLSADGYIVRSVRHAPDLTSPLLPGNILDQLRNIDFGLLTEILNLLRADGSNPSFHLSRATAYVSKSLFSSNGFLPVDIDSMDSGPNSNTLWKDVGLRPQPSQLNHVVRVEVDHPLGAPPQNLEFGAYSTAGTASAPLVSVSGVRIESESTLTRSVYRVNVPVDSLVASARAVSLTPLPNENRLTLEFRPVPPPGSTAPVSPRQFTPNILFNARYRNFVDPSDGVRSYYSSNSSSLVSAKLAKTILALDTIGATSTRPGHTNDLFINDGALPFGLSFEPEHDGHEDGEKLDVRPFGQVENPSYVGVNRNPLEGPLFLPGSKFSDIAILMRVTRAADEFNRTLSAPLLRQSQCLINTIDSSAVNPCTNRVTVEQCLFMVASPDPGSSCAVIHAAVYNASPAIMTKAVSVASHNRLRDWVLRNREALIALKVETRSLSLNTVVYQSSGQAGTTRSLIAALVNMSGNSVGRIPAVAGQVNYKRISSKWNVDSLLKGAVPLVADPSGMLPAEFHLLDSGGGSLPDLESDLLPMFDFDPTNGHLDHYHLKPGSR